LIVAIESVLVPLDNQKLLLQQVKLVLELWVPGHERFVGELSERHGELVQLLLHLVQRRHLKESRMKSREKGERSARDPEADKRAGGGHAERREAEVAGEEWGMKKGAKRGEGAGYGERPEAGTGAELVWQAKESPHAHKGPAVGKHLPGRERAW
jgi:hypothetical protein